MFPARTGCTEPLALIYQLPHYGSNSPQDSLNPHQLLRRHNLKHGQHSHFQVMGNFELEQIAPQRLCRDQHFP